MRSEEDERRVSNAARSLSPRGTRQGDDCCRAGPSRADRVRTRGGMGGPYHLIELAHGPVDVEQHQHAPRTVQQRPRLVLRFLTFPSASKRVRRGEAKVAAPIQPRAPAADRVVACTARLARRRMKTARLQTVVSMITSTANLKKTCDRHPTFQARLESRNEGSCPRGGGGEGDGEGAREGRGEGGGAGPVGFVLRARVQL